MAAFFVTIWLKMDGVDIKLAPGKYVVAVSGGVDSIVLLDLLAKSSQNSVELVVAHFNHGIRRGSEKDEKLVAAAAKKYGLTIEVGHGHLGRDASEEKARQARYGFLESVKKHWGAKAIITAHHQDDLIETAMINILRGTGRRGLSAIADNPLIIRPLLNVPKKDVTAYGRRNNLDWHEDPTNLDTKYLRNYLRVKVIPKMTAIQKSKFLNNLGKIAKTNKELDQLIATISHSLIDNQEIDRGKFISLPPEIADEILAGWLRYNKITQYDKKTIERISIALKTAKPGTKVEAVGGRTILIGLKSAHLAGR